MDFCLYMLMNRSVGRPNPDKNSAVLGYVYIDCY